MKRKNKISLLVVSLLLYSLQTVIAQTQIPINPSMITTDGDTSVNIADEQNLLNGHPLTKWDTSWNPNAPSFPHHATIDLGGCYDLSSIHIYDMNGQANMIVEYKNAAGTWANLFTDPLLKYLKWNNHPVNVTTNSIRLTKTSGDAIIGEIILFGSSASNGCGGSGGCTPGKLTLTPSMLTDESGTNAYKLIDEQTIAGDPANNAGGSPTSNWFAGWNTANYPASAYIDLGQSYQVTKIYLRDINDIGNFKVYYGTPNNWTLLFTDSLEGYNTWNEHNGTTTRYLRFVKEDSHANVSEVVIYANCINPVGTIPHPNLSNTDTGIKIFSNNPPLHKVSSHIIGANRNHVESGDGDHSLVVAEYGKIQPSFGKETMAERKKIYRLGHGITDGVIGIPWAYGYHFENHWNSAGPYPYDDIRYGLEEAKSMDAEVTMVVNFGTGDANEAGRLVGFLNQTNNSLRNTYRNNVGSNAPWNVKYFEIGNEISWEIERGHDTYAATPAAYANRAKTFAIKMRAKSDIPIKIGLVGTASANWTANWPNDLDYTNHRVPSLKTMINIMGNQLDFIVYHEYVKYPFNTSSNIEKMCQLQFSRDLIKNWVIPTMEEAETDNINDTPNKEIKLANTEYHAEIGSNHPMGETIQFLYTAGVMINAISIERIIMASNFCLSHGNISVDNLFFKNYLDPSTITGVYKVHEMVANKLGTDVIESSYYNAPKKHLTGIGMIDPNGNHYLNSYGYPNGNFDLEKIGYVATKRADGSLAILILNKMENENINIPIDPSFDVSSATIQTIKGNSYSDTNYQVVNNNLTDLNNVTIPATSVNMITITPKINKQTFSNNDNSKLNTETINVYPNPTKDLINIRAANGIKKVLIFDQLGKAVKTNQTDLNQLDISDFSDGIYFLKITDNNGTVFTKKIVKE